MNNAQLLLLICTILAPIGLVPVTDAARILGFFSTGTKSHLLIHCSIAEQLARAGHEVTIIGITENVYPNATYKHIRLQLSDVSEKYTKTLFDVVNGRMSFLKTVTVRMRQYMNRADEIMRHPWMREFLRNSRAGDYDLLLFGFLMNEYQIGLAAHFRCPIVMTWVIQPALQIHRFVGNPQQLSYVPSFISAFKQPMNFMERVNNFLVTQFEQNMLVPYLDYNTQKLYDYNFPSDRYPPLDEVRKNVSLIFTNHHFSQGPIRPNVPNLIEIGGIQIKEKPDPLPTDIAKVLDESKEGVIYFSLGSNIKGSHLNEEKIKIMFNVISKLPYKVLWKWSPTELPGESKNIIFRDWLPQDDILAHPNVKLFITHGGMGSVVESQYHGVPMVGIPLFGDQPSNMVNVERSGYGLAVDYLTLSEESLNNAIQDVLNNPKYKEAVQTFSRLYRDRPMTPRETVVYWVNYVLRHKGAKHMQSPAVHMNRWQLLSLDVIGFLLAIVLTISVVIVKVCKLICCRGRKNKLPKVEKAKQN
uniref:UDP-glucuronosyltransferase 1-1 n=1 Tax=Bactrocera latifrons TaxID=174628 RepID=A0A0K8VAA1_BACLA